MALKRDCDDGRVTVRIYDGELCGGGGEGGGVYAVVGERFGRDFD